MFDGIKFIIRGFSGHYADHPEGRKLIWAHIIVTLFSFCTLIFTAYVSYTRYVDLVGTILPHAELVAILFTSAIALFMLTASSYVAVFLIQFWVREEGQRELTWKGALIFCTAAIMVGIIDFHMNLDGARDLATKSAGIVAPLNTQPIIDRFDRQINPLIAEQKAILKKYTWKGTLYFKPTRYRPLPEYTRDKQNYDNLTTQISDLRNAKNTAISTAQSNYRSRLSDRDTKKATTFLRLSIAVKYIYFLQFLLAIVSAYIAHVLSQGKAQGPLFTLPARLKRSNNSMDNKPSQNQIGYSAIHKDTVGEEGINTHINTELNSLIRELGGTPLLDLNQKVSPDSIAFLKKYKHVVQDILAEKTYSEIKRDHKVSKSTAQNVKRTMKAVQLI